MSSGRVVAAAQGAYYVATGVWPLVHMRSFLAVTGPKRDLWLVRTVGVLVTAIGVSLLASSGRREVPREARLLGFASAAGLAAAEAVFYRRGKVGAVYLADAALEAGLAAAWLAAGRGR